MDKDHNNMVTADEYIKVFLQAEEILSSKLNKISANIKTYLQEKTRILNDFEEALQIEKLNEYGIMFGSVLEVSIINATELKMNDFDQYNVMSYCLVSCASRKFQTKLEDYNNPVWNESFSL